MYVHDIVKIVITAQYPGQASMYRIQGVNVAASIQTYAWNLYPT